MENVAQHPEFVRLRSKYAGFRAGGSSYGGAADFQNFVCRIPWSLYQSLKRHPMFGIDFWLDVDETMNPALLTPNGGGDPPDEKRTAEKEAAKKAAEKQAKAEAKAAAKAEKEAAEKAAKESKKAAAV